ncbi:acyl-CoA carboxylase subunit epsilon [Streptomyces lincolnensis]|uniref:acyl-CoA carboxylase subunit epsilon n=1 Tax=Streptomyces lincolnensis TaxID=1915 RepID=UPI001E65C881|nr:acyl-CoA carboxylase subunit epsilon [Streptomyces lincolnensis]MCD7438675.1 acyl-CoA carboxylase subunit epsilon [Streptomyces lincolnensis]
MSTLVSVKRGNATPEELAALTAVLVARAAHTAPPAPRSTAAWRPPVFRAAHSWQS